MKKLYETLLLAEPTDPRTLPPEAQAAIVLDDRMLDIDTDAPMILYWAILPAPVPDAPNVSCQPGPWLERISVLCEILDNLMRRGQNTILYGSAAANLAAAHLVRNRGLVAAQILPTFAGLDGFDEKGLAAIESAIPGRRLVMAPSVQPPQHVKPVGVNLMVQPPQLAAAIGPFSQAPLTVSPAGVGPQAPPPPQSGMTFSPLVGSQPGQATSQPSTAQDRAVDAALSKLPGHRANLIGQMGENKPVPPPANQLVSVFDLSKQQQASGGGGGAEPISGDRVISASDGGVVTTVVVDGDGKPIIPG